MSATCCRCYESTNHEKATRRSVAQPSQRTRAKPWARMPQRRQARKWVDPDIAKLDKPPPYLANTSVP